ncbi:MULTISPECIES: hypothetical protein [Streptomyces]|uniref:Uncharacterized protein n=1 Tax=Streptomyces coelicolor (strain ATCC BAA-471 / A3(2) / M145) TaxID=100226 RepID=Q9L1P5_STRCO|nr:MULTISPECIES: hypothetical protein [Streptomyces]MDX2929207.1 hypothetical protein [Streptomyces sp. NRRL_B-16638]MDX3410978.1 hypothetical protein [Streptomyces sp. ME02-6977A]MYU46376.1 hypothetical protein [Streptomyces sp. SID7813]QFI46649.1 hypothetical protein FQ762_35440 [Streptomyces coelicolor A3(2)]TYP14006.1 hypothetical protein FHV91_102466 [Streptomyces coelicolor]
MPLIDPEKIPLSVRSFIARPTTGTGYCGIHVQLDGVPSHHLPLLLAAYQYRFGRDVEAMARHLIDDVTVGWDELGTDLLDGAPPALVTTLTGGEHWPSRTLDRLVTPDGSPPMRMTVTDATADAQDLQWGYVLHAEGIEVISILHADNGPLVDWAIDPRTAFNDHPAAWSPGPVPPRRGPRAAASANAPAAAPVKAGSPRSVGRR